MAGNLASLGDKHKNLGQVFTPVWVVAEILNLVGFAGAGALDKKIIDPACGDGAFLKIIVERIIARCRELNYSAAATIAVLERGVYGIEIDRVECENCLRNLDALARERLQTTAKINWQIHNENALHFYKKLGADFDFVVGNPPYIRIHNLDAATRELLKTEFAFSAGTIDIYVSFFELGFKLLNRRGALGYITPNSYLHNASYAAFRRHLKNHKAVKTLIDFKSHKVFENFATYTAITVINFFDRADAFAYKELRGGDIVDINTVAYADVTDGDWSFSGAADMAFLKSLRASGNKRVADFFDVQYGFATLRDNIFIGGVSERAGDLARFNGAWVEQSLLRKVVKGSTYKGAAADCEHIIFPYRERNGRWTVIAESAMRAEYPRLYAYLLSHKAELQKRDMDSGCLWYEFGRSQGVQTSRREKIVVSALLKDAIRHYDLDEDTFVYSGIFIIRKRQTVSWSIIKDILNSDAFLKYIKITGKDLAGGYKTITSKQIKNFPTRIAAAQARVI